MDFTGSSSIERRHRSLLKAGRSMPFWGKNTIPFSLFPFPHPFALPMRLAAAWQILSLGFALALLILSVPNASAQQITSHNSKEDFNTLGVAGGNKGPQGLWSDGMTMLVSDVDGKIYSYDLETKQRQDSHHNDRRVGTPAAAEEGANTDDFILYKDGSTTETIRPYGLWATNSTLWVGSTEGSRTNKTAKLYAYTMTWNTGKDVRTDLDGEERYLKGTRDSTKDINLHRQTDSLPDLDANGNPIVFEVHTNNGGKHKLSYDPEVVTEGEETRTVYHLLNKDGNRLTRNSEGKLTTQDGVVYENENISFQTNMVTGPVGNLSPTGIWSDGTTIWVADQGDYIEFVSDGKNERFFSPDKIYAYKLTLEEDRRVPAEDIQLSIASGRQEAYDYTLDKNTYAQGIWSDGETMWVANIQGAADSAEKRIYAYNMWTNSPTDRRMFDGSRDPTKDYKNLNKEGNINDNDRPRGIWSDGKTMWVTDSGSDKIYAYNLLPPPPPPSEVSENSGDSEDSTLSDLRLSGIELSPVFFPDRRIYTVLVDHDVAKTTVTATPNDSKATVNIYWGGPSSTRSTAGKDPQVALNQRHNVIAIDVTAENGSGQTYIVEVTKSEAPPVSGGPLPGGEVRFVFLVVSAEEFRLETSSSLISGN